MSGVESICSIVLPQHGDDRGYLVTIEGGKSIPFEIKRVFFIFGTESKTVRGKHANRDSEFFFVNVSGKSKIRVNDGKGNESVFCLDKPNLGLYLPKMVWKEMYDFSSDSVLLVFASTYYDANEYIRSFEDFEKEVKGVDKV